MKAAIPSDKQKFGQLLNSSSGRKAIAADLIKSELTPVLSVERSETSLIVDLVRTQKERI
jgi:hypothetical protein